MKLKWDYTNLAESYLKRPGYSEAAVDAMLDVSKVSKLSSTCDVGAGAAHLTLMLAKRGFNVVAVEPNKAMRINGIKRTDHLKNIVWKVGTGEHTGLKSDQFDLVTFGSSFNVCDRNAALLETARILKDKGWFACMWNHRVLDDPIQQTIEEIIKNYIGDYRYGSRREDQAALINSTQLFEPVIHISSSISHSQTLDDCVEAWKSHATLKKQAGQKFESIVLKIEEFLKSLKVDSVNVPYVTNIWTCRLT